MANAYVAAGKQPAEQLHTKTSFTAYAFWPRQCKGRKFFASP